MNFISDMLSTANAGMTPRSRHSSSELATAVVRENWNEQFPGCVKVEYILGESGKYSSDWIRVLQPYAGKEYGEYFLPEIGSEVLVAFVSGDTDCAVVLGCLYNSSKNKLPRDVANKENTVKYIKTKGGHEIRISEEKGKEKLEIKTPGELQFIMNDEEQKIECRDKSGSNKMLLDGKNKQISIEAEKKLELVSGSAKIVLDGGAGRLELNGSQIKAEGKQSMELNSQSLKAEGAMTEIKAKGSLIVEASGMAQIKGAMLKLN